ncbi:uncharacterized protein L201_004394 [Kwoniella dendrophila CBS 6074]|uniref:Uncharacterized protein n=1 Tax=Kwoniella dendrophila CBS 6074 TaxID=1295534 RepID=A0AAX4JVK6_9TREE
MSQEEGDIPSTTPLDLLINAIAGSTDYPYSPTQTYQDSIRAENDATPFSHEGHGGEPVQVSVDQEAKDAQRVNRYIDRHKYLGSPTSRQKETSQIIADYIVQAQAVHSGSATNYQGRATKIEIWHPSTGQKSYGKERRIIAPPPKLCISGPLLSSVASVTMSTTSLSSSASPSNPTMITTSSSQTHKIASSTIEDIDPELFVSDPSPEITLSKNKGKRAKKSNRKTKIMSAARSAGFGGTLPRWRKAIEGKERESLSDGLNFPGLWIGEDIGKNKEFNLELKIMLEDHVPTQHDEGAFNNEKGRTVAQDLISNGDLAKIQDIQPFENIDQSIQLSEVLDSSSIDVLQPLAAAVQQVNEAARQALAEDSPELRVPGEADLTQLPTPYRALDENPSQDVSIPQEIAIPSTPRAATPMPTQPAMPYATFISNPLKLISKPSQKTAKARSMSSCLSIDSSFALWTRINAQTVRTKYMRLEVDESNQSNEAEEDSFAAKLTSKTGKWTPFKFEIIKRVTLPIIDKKNIRSASHNQPQPPSNFLVSDSIDQYENILTYGSIVKLVDLQSGIQSDPVKIVRIEDNGYTLGEHEGHPVSELQRIGLVRLHDDGDNDYSERLTEKGERWYLSAPGARMGGGEVIPGMEYMRSLGRGGRAKPTFTNQKSKTSIAPAPSGPIGENIPIPETLNNVEQTSDMPNDVNETLNSSNAPTTALEKRKADYEEGKQLQTPVKKRKKTKRNALASAVLAEDEEGNSQIMLSWVKAENREEINASVGLKDAVEGEDRSQNVTVDRVEDWMSWIIGGVACSSQTLFSTTNINQPSSPTPCDIQDGQKRLGSEATSIDPIPQILIPPKFDSEQNTLDLTLSQFHFPSSSSSSSPLQSSQIDDEPLEIYLGPIGPLYYTTWKSTSPKNTPTLAIPFNRSRNQEVTDTINHYKVYSTYPSNKKHIIVQVHMPNAEEIIQVMKDCLVRATEEKERSSGDDAIRDKTVTFEEDDNNAKQIQHTTKGDIVVAGRNSKLQENLIDQNTAIRLNDFEQETTTAEENPIDQPNLHDDVAIPELSSETRIEAPPLEPQSLWFDEQEDTESHQNKLSELSIEAALSMTDNDFNTLHELGPFVQGEDDPNIIAEHNNDNNGGIAQATEMTEEGMVIDPSLKSQPIPKVKDVDFITQINDQSQVEQQPELETIKLHQSSTSNKNNNKEKNHDLIPLPFLLFRQSDNMVFGIGKSVIAQNINSTPTYTKNPKVDLQLQVISDKDQDNLKWGLRVIDM